MVPGMHAAGRFLALVSLLLAPACATLHFEPTGPHAGTFRSTAMAFTFLGNDYPQSAVLVARANASDSQLPNLVITRERIFPYLWRLDFLLDVLSLRWATVSGTYGPPD
jgi:hypothetical protein